MTQLQKHLRVIGLILFLIILFAGIKSFVCSKHNHDAVFQIPADATSIVDWQ